MRNPNIGKGIRKQLSVLPYVPYHFYIDSNCVAINKDWLCSVYSCETVYVKWHEISTAKTVHAFSLLLMTIKNLLLLKEGNYFFNYILRITIFAANFHIYFRLFYHRTWFFTVPLLKIVIAVINIIKIRIM